MLWVFEKLAPKLFGRRLSKLISPKDSASTSLRLDLKTASDLDDLHNLHSFITAYVKP